MGRKFNDAIEKRRPGGGRVVALLEAVPCQRGFFALGEARRRVIADKQAFGGANGSVGGGFEEVLHEEGLADTAAAVHDDESRLAGDRQVEVGQEVPEFSVSSMDRVDVEMIDHVEVGEILNVGSSLQ